MCVWRSNFGIFALSKDSESFEAIESSFTSGRDEGKENPKKILQIFPHNEKDQNQIKE